MSLHPPTELESIKALLGDGLSRARIGVRLGLSRDTIYGLVRRMQQAGVELPHPPKPPPVAKPAIVRAPKKPQAITVVPCATAVALLALGDHACHWPVAGEGVGMLFCGAGRSEHPSYCRHHAARSVAVDAPRMFAGECPSPLLSA